MPVRLATFDEAAHELVARGIPGYPCLGPEAGPKKILKTVEELDAALGNDRAPSDWDHYVQLAIAIEREIDYRNLEAPTATASDAREAKFLRSQSEQAYERAKSLWGAAVSERGAQLRSDGHQVRVARDGDWSGATGQWTALPRGTRDEVSGPRWVRTHDMRDAALQATQRWSDHEVVSHYAEINRGRENAIVGQHGSLGQLVRALTTSTGSAVVPTVWLGDIIDRARNYAAVLQAGAEIIPMDAKTVQIGRLTTDPTAAFRTEGSTITASDPVFDNVTLTANTMSTLVVGSMEWFQDADNVDAVVTNAIAKAFAGQLDLVALYGSITSGAGSINLATPPNPRGVLGALNATAASSVLGAAANGTAQTAASYWNEVLDTIYTPQDYNEKPNALIWNSKAARQYAKAYDTTGQPLQLPSDVAAVDRYVSNQIPSYTQGTMTNRATDLFVGDWTQLLIGQRLEFQLKTLTERYAENGQIGIAAHWRGDVGVARPRAFSVYKSIQGA